MQGHSDYIKTTVVCPYYISTGMFAGVEVGGAMIVSPGFIVYLLQSKLIPILEPEFVADNVVNATLTNKEVS